jgi:glycerol-3-phosphate dehydrogenase
VSIPHAATEPRPTPDEIDFILETAGRYLARGPRREDVLSTFAGVRPLVKGDGKKTASLSRDHVIVQDQPGLLTMTGGKWTTYREMAEECVDRAARLVGLPRRPCPTGELRIHGYHADPASLKELAVYGTDAAAIRLLLESDPVLAEKLHPALPYCAAEVVWAVRSEMARTAEDVLARRTRALFLNAGAAVQIAPQVAALMARELDRDADWTAGQVRAFNELARGYRVPSG